ncbi:heme/hemin ABC transporter substrate-binding protein [Marinibacterium sp. SX1]|uniref:heme/hemin ABC transporter substrate-binding protein n=1 Tax=Marinibacterium sp. SX1 TaxID=3388424 RepID=UPI003D17D550
MNRPPVLRTLALGLALCLWLAAGVLPAGAQAIDATDVPAYPPLFAPSDAAGGARDIVLLGADLVEIAVALGAADRILARPADIDLPGIGDTPHQVREWAGVEGIVAMRPGLVIASNVRFDTLRAGLEELGIDTVLIDRSLPATDKVRRLAARLGLDDRGAALVAAIEADYARAAALRPERAEPLRIIHASKQGAGGNFTVGGAGTGVHNLIERVGAINAAAVIGMDRYRSVTPEGIITMAPDVILVADSELPAFGDLDGFWQDYPGVAFTPAGQDRRIIVMRQLHLRDDAASSGIAALALARALAGIDDRP